MKVQRIMETCIYCRDLVAAEAFYTTVLGCEVLTKEPDRHVFFKLANAMLLVFNPDNTMSPGSDIPPHGAYGEGHVAFAMSDDQIGKWRKKLADNNVSIEMEIEWPNGGISIYFRDPANNSVELITPKTWGY